MNETKPIYQLSVEFYDLQLSYGISFKKKFTICFLVGGVIVGRT